MLTGDTTYERPTEPAGSEQELAARAAHRRRVPGDFAGLGVSQHFRDQALVEARSLPVLGLTRGDVFRGRVAEVQCRRRVEERIVRRDVRVRGAMPAHVGGASVLEPSLARLLGVLM